MFEFEFDFDISLIQLQDVPMNGIDNANKVKLLSNKAIGSNAIYMYMYQVVILDYLKRYLHNFSNLHIVFCDFFKVSLMQKLQKNMLIAVIIFLKWWNYKV